MVADTITGANNRLTLFLVLAGVVVAVALSYVQGPVLGVILGLPIALIGLLVRFRSGNVWRCRSCGQCIDRP